MALGSVAARFAKLRRWWSLCSVVCIDDWPVQKRALPSRSCVRTSLGSSEVFIAAGSDCISTGLPQIMDIPRLTAGAGRGSSSGLEGEKKWTSPVEMA
jgi:hypothetical protein